MSHIGATFNFPPLCTSTNEDQLHTATPNNTGSPPTNYLPFGSNTTAPSQTFRDTPLSFSSSPIIDTLVINNLAKDFCLEPIQHANPHAFIQVNSPGPDSNYHFLLTLYQDRFGRWDPVKVQLANSCVHACCTVC